MGIGETLRQALVKLVMRAAGEQAKTAYGNLQLCVGLEAGIEGATYAVGTEDDVTWVASNLSGTAGALGAEAMEMKNWLLCFGCASEELRVVVARLADWMANSSPPLGRLSRTDGLPPSCPG